MISGGCRCVGVGGPTLPSSVAFSELEAQNMYNLYWGERVLARPKILVVDDEESQCLGRTSILRQSLDVETSYALDGAEALQHVSNEPPDLILLDYEMPAVNGMQFLLKLRQARVKTRVIIVSGFADLELTLDFAKLGVCGVYRKPCDPQKLVSAVKKALALESPLSLYSNESTPLLEEAIKENSALTQELEVKCKEIVQLKEQVRSLSNLDLKRKLAVEKTMALKRQLKEQSRKTTELTETLQSASHRDRLGSAVYRIAILTVAAVVMITFNRLRMVIDRGTIFYLSLLFLLLSLPFDRIRSFIGRYKEAEARADFSSDPERTSAGNPPKKIAEMPPKKTGSRMSA